MHKHFLAAGWHAGMSSFRRLPKLKLYFKNDASVYKRFKSLLAYLHNSGDSSKLTEFFAEQGSKVIALLAATLRALNQSRQSRPVADAHSIIEVLTTLVSHWGSHPREWEYERLLQLFSTLLFHGNDLRIRKSGVSLLLHYTECVFQADRLLMPDSRLVRLLRGSLDLLSFLSELPVQSPKLQTQLESYQILGSSSFMLSREHPKQGSVRTRESRELLNVVLSFLLFNCPVSRYQTWNQFISSVVFSILYPKSYNGLSGFSPYCPESLQASVVIYIHRMLRDKPREGFFWSNQSAKLVVEVFRQALALSSENLPTINTVLAIVRRWVAAPFARLPSPFASAPQEFLHTNISSLFHVFEKIVRVPSDSFDDSIEIEACEYALGILRAVSSKPLDDDTKDTLLVTLLNITALVIQCVDSDQGVVFEFAQLVIDTLFEIFLCSNSVEMWSNFHSKAVQWSNLTFFIDAWRNKLICLTSDLISFSIEDAKANEWNTTNGKLLQPGFVKGSIYEGWLLFLSLFDDLSSVSCTISRQQLLSTILESLGLFLERITLTPKLSREDKLAALGKKRSTVSPREFLPKGNLLMKVYSPWIFPATMSNGTVKCHALELLCKLFSTKFDEQWEDHYLDEFYQVIHITLMETPSNDHQVVILASDQLFTSDLPKLFLLYSPYINYIKQVLSDTSVKSCPTRQACITILFSMITLPGIYGDAEISNLQSEFGGTDTPNECSRISHSGWKVRHYFELDKIVFDLFVTGIRFDEDSTVVGQCIWGLTIYIHDHIISSSPLPWLSGALEVLLECILFPNVSHVALEAIKSFSTHIPQLVCCSNDAGALVLDRLLKYAEVMISKVFKRKSKLAIGIVVETLLTLSEWVMAMKSRWIKYEVWELLNNGITGFKAEDSINLSRHHSITSDAYVVQKTCQEVAWYLLSHSDPLQSHRLGVGNREFGIELHVGIAGGAIFSVYQSNNGPQQIIVRNVAGRFVYDGSLMTVSIDSVLNDKDQQESLDVVESSEISSTLPDSRAIVPGLLKHILESEENAIDLQKFYFQHLKAEDMVLLENGKKLSRSLKLLDDVSDRECHKIGVLYVAKGQEHQNSILANESGSQDYEDFINALGSLVELKHHSWFCGGLDPSDITGSHAPYWSNSSTEVIFHVATRMPTNPEDPQQIHKKKHVGNDHTRIVWSDSQRDYLESTISSSFGDVHIVIYPMVTQEGLYRVQVLKKDGIGDFGPLQDGMVVPGKLLPDLVRSTVINANRTVRSAAKAYDRPYPTRGRYIEQLIAKNCSCTLTRSQHESLYSN